ncbi:tRNA 2-thiocytidine biosynthesis protein TtcA [Crassaminicella thermophila]|uniref:tRNA 2-thiocytidine biosynthesis protein TtcA n=1 Tax=Crassaminicella thermophila TaxID=2599308 RepID=A0A5C0SDA6_CRATE|nr:tRNA 2-thiocytidine biosynthesis TtcA family protein [Crassaminicella thermophila]QEK11887.1 tRNA 2-thiocytidine biosynthesis protein TtcA [Crassaminicella thermophila]
MIKFEKKYNKLFLNNIRKAITDYEMIQPNDKIAVGLSGGKDSIFLLFCLKLIQQTSIKNFEFIGIHIDLGFSMDIESLKSYCTKNNIPLIIEKTNIADVIFNDRKEKNPCSLCSKLRRGALARVSKNYNVNKIALGHNADDVIETLFMNVLKVGKLGTFHPNSYNSEKDMHIIRPMIYIRENLIESFVNKFNLPVITSTCPKDKKTVREDMKKLLFQLEKIYPDASEKILSSLSNFDLNNLWKKYDI